MTSRIQRFTDVAAFAKAATPWLLRLEPEHNLILGLLGQLGRNEVPLTEPLYMAVVEVDGAMAGCALRTPPHKLIVTRMPAAALPALAADVSAAGTPLPAVLGPDATAREFARCWCARHEVRARAGMRQRLYVLHHVRPPARPAPGSLCLATLQELTLVESWIGDFAGEAGVQRVDPRRHAAARVAAGDIALWWHDGARSMAGVSGRSRNGVRIGYVYTPPQYRGRGYATACVAALTQRSLERGAVFCCLYTDLSNPTSNSIYQQIGYEPECDFIDVHFDA